jgi:23S rRNA pseudouridine1911/1915/1917 synthase
MDHSESIGDWVIYRNNQLIAFNKPAGMPTQSDPSGDPALLDLARTYTKGYVQVLHRLDRPTSGAVLFARRDTALESLNEQFRTRKVRKTYLAIVEQRPEQDSGTLVHYLEKGGQNRAVARETASPGSQRAELDYRYLMGSDRYHLLEIDLRTGRHHQIRAQLAAIGSPVRGDLKYGARRSRRGGGIDLHAWKLAFDHPISGATEEIVAPLPSTNLWQYFAAQLPASPAPHQEEE